MSKIEIVQRLDNSCFRATDFFDVAKLPWNKKPKNFWGRFKWFNTNMQYRTKFSMFQPVLIKNGDDLWATNYFNFVGGPDHFYKYPVLYEVKHIPEYKAEWYDRWIPMALNAGLLKEDKISDTDVLGIRMAEIKRQVDKGGTTFINDIEVRPSSSLNFDNIKGYLEISGFNREGKKETLLIRDILNIKIG